MGSGCQVERNSLLLTHQHFLWTEHKVPMLSLDCDHGKECSHIKPLKDEVEQRTFAGLDDQHLEMYHYLATASMLFPT